MSVSSEQENLDEILAQEVAGLNQRIRDDAPAERRKIGFFTVVCLILNRTIGSGIFVVPRNVLLGTGSVGASLILWVVGALASMCGLLVWLELGLSIPRHVTPDGRVKSVPRSGGEKNYLEYMLQTPKFFATCLFGVIFIILGNLSGNSIQFGIYVMQASGIYDPSREAVIGCAIAALTVSCLVHVFSRRGGIMLSNVFAVFKVSVLLAIIVIGFAAAGGGSIGPGAQNHTANFSASSSFAGASSRVANYGLSLLSILYSFSGFEQPFYVLSEVRSPRRIFPKATITAMTLAGVLFFLVNVAYMSAIPTDPDFLASGNDMTILFFQRIFGPGAGPRVMAGVAASCIFGNIIVMTFTASRVKQEIAKEGILPFSLFFATGRTTPDAWIRRKLHERRLRREARARRGDNAVIQPHELAADEDIALPEQTPMAALLLHWAVSVLLVGATAMLPSAVAYFALVFVYTYVLVIVVPLLISVGMLVLRFRKGSDYLSEVQSFKPWGGPAPAILYGAVCLFLVIAPFLDPGTGTPWSFEATRVRWWILPTIGLSSLLWGPAWWVGLQVVMRKKGRELVVTRLPHIEQDEEDGEWVQRAEVVDHVWKNVVYTESQRYRKESGGGNVEAVVVQSRRRF